ncbi:MAG: AMP-binding protein [Kiritimatiellia bacterium]
MLFEAFKRNRQERPDGEAFLIPSGDRYFPVSWKRFTDDIALVAWIVDTYAPKGVVAVLGENSYDWMVVHAAILFRGGTVVPVDPNLTPEEISRRLVRVGAVALIHSSLYADKAHAVGRLTPGLATGGFGTRKTDVVLLAAKTAFKVGVKTLWERDEVPEALSHTATIVFTSGTTSEPRGVELTLKAIETFVESTSRALPMTPGERSLMMLPLHHIFGICATYTMLANGVGLGVCTDFRRIYDAFERFRVNFAFLVPALADILANKIALKCPSAEEAFGQPIDWILTGGASLSRRTYEKLTALGIKTISGYGLTETAACYAMAFRDDPPHICSAGRVSQLPEVETKVSASGELLVRGPNVMKGYYRMPERTAQAIDADGWFHTGDVGRIDEDGYVWITGRASRTIILSSGKKIAPEELEEKLQQLPGILEAVVSGEGETRDVRAEIYASIPEPSARRAIAALNQTLPVYQRIKTVVVRKEPFPRTSSGKVKLG